MTHLNDQALLAHWYRHRNAEAFHILASRHARMVYATALRVLRDAQDAEDVSQESFLALAEARRPPTRHVAAWLHQTAYRRALELIRARTRRNARETAYGAAQPHVVHSEWDDIRALLDEAVAGLPTTYREPLVRHFFEQESHATIAAALGIPRQTVTHRIGKGIETVRQHLKLKGVVTLTGAALVTLIHENTAHALPATLAAELGRIALAAKPSIWAAAGTYTGGVALKVAAAVLVVGGATAVMLGAGSGERAVTAAPEPAFEAPKDFEPVAEKSTLEHEVAAEPDAAQVRGTEAENSPGTLVYGAGPDPLRSASVSGRVTLPDGRPFAGATVEMFVRVPFSLLNPSIATSDSDGTPTTIRDQNAMIGMSHKADTNSAGEFSAVELYPGDYVLNVFGPDGNGGAPGGEFARFTLAVGEQKRGVELPYGSEGDLSVSGMVTDGRGAPLSGIRVVCVQPIHRISMTDGSGRFTIAYVPDGVVALQAMGSEAFAGRQEATRVRAGATDAHLVLQRNASIEGRAIDAKTRQPLISFQVVHLPGHQIGSRRSDMEVNPPPERPGGNFKIDHVSPGDVTVVAQAPGYAAAYLHVNVAEGESLKGLELALERSEGRIAGVVVDEAGQPVSGAAVYLEDVPSGPVIGTRLPAAATGPNGKFTIDVAPEEVQFIGVAHQDFAPGGNEPEAHMKVTLKKAARLHVEVRTAGQPLRDVRLYATGYGAPGERVNQTSARRTTGPDGRATVEQVAPGKVCVEVKLPSRRARLVFVELAPGEEKVLSIEFPPASAVVEGTVVANGAPLTAGWLRLYVDTESGTEFYDTSVADDGAFRIAEVAPGMAQIVVTAEDAARAMVDDVPLAVGEVTTLEVDATMLAGVRGAVSGMDRYADFAVEVYPGTLDIESAIQAADSIATQRGSAGGTTTDASGNYTIPLHKPGVYTLLLISSPKEKYWRKTYHEARVVEVGEDGALEVDFDLRQ